MSPREKEKKKERVFCVTTEQPKLNTLDESGAGDGNNTPVVPSYLDKKLLPFCPRRVGVRGHVSRGEHAQAAETLGHGHRIHAGHAPTAMHVQTSESPLHTPAHQSMDG